jgi:hypothetical protein
VKVVSDVGGGDVFAHVYSIARWIYQAPASQALAYALGAAASAISGREIRPFQS